MYTSSHNEYMKIYKKKNEKVSTANMQSLEKPFYILKQKKLTTLLYIDVFLTTGEP